MQNAQNSFAHWSNASANKGVITVFIIVHYCVNLLFPGAIDGKHVVQCPASSGSMYFNYKNTFSIVLLAVGDADYCFTYVDVGAYGKENDSAIFKSSSFGRLIASGDLDLPAREGLSYTFVGDEAFQLSEQVMRPYP